MKPLRGILVSDGSSDRMLFPILRWIFNQAHIEAIELSRPDLGLLRIPPKTLKDRILTATAYGPCDIVFIHRDAETNSFHARSEEIEHVLRELNSPHPFIKIVPVRMSEAWLLINEQAIRKVAQKPRGHSPLEIPPVCRLEALPDPKQTLIDLLITASEAKGRRLDQLKTESRSLIHQLAEFIPDFSPLRELLTFQTLEADIRRLISNLHAD